VHYEDPVREPVPYTGDRAQDAVFTRKGGNYGLYPAQAALEPAPRRRILVSHLPPVVFLKETVARMAARKGSVRQELF
jgi:hypothetical protein